ncbi:bifunctional UDP-sugar hydrolase/5'-nucleotidase [Aeribacillus sp. FSL K6-1121]|uniref:bifunctional metallophosphatase/5'-nucleotidase n=1 Tax=unclassified Aeribacillus TaxID=2640495 RepID=UPI0030F6116C
MEKETAIHLLVTSDLHGYIYPTNYRDKEEQNFGLAKIATIIKEKRKKGYVLLLDNGDLIQGSPLTYYHAKNRPDSENPMIQVMNDLQYDACVLGNHEFNYGRSYLQKAIDQSAFPWLSANILKQTTGEPAFGTPYLVKVLDGVKIAVLGITTHFIPNWEEPRNIEGLVFKDALQTAKLWVSDIRQKEKPDVMIVSYHGGFERDLQTGEPIEQLTGENQAYQMCQELEGVDILITGHQHRPLADKLNGITIIQPGHKGQFLGEVTMKVRQKANGNSPAIVSHSNLIKIDEKMEANQDVLALISDIEQETQKWLDQPIGTVIGDMTVSDPLKTRLQDNPFIEFINKVQMETAKVDISATALFNNDLPGFKQHVTMRDIVSNYIYPNTLTVIRISGQDIKDALEQSAKYFTVQNGTISVNPAFLYPKPQHYNYDMWEGIEYELKISNPVGQRVVKLNYHGSPLELDKEYDVVMNSYRAGGTGNFDMFKEKPIVKNIPIDMTELIANYILEHKTIIAACNHNWRVVL